jgi:Spy/CpxP family protein refolding chaperone
MKKFRDVALFCLASWLSATSVIAASPYAGEQSREIKALSADDIAGLRAGKGMGYAKAAELNGFAGPAHVLELADALGLTPEQRARTEALFASMSAKASARGRALVDKERELDALFASRTVTPERLASSLQAIGALQAQVRQAHLEAHLAQVQILTAEQNARYAELRGYGRNAPGGERGHGAHRH